MSKPAFKFVEPRFGTGLIDVKHGFTLIELLVVVTIIVVLLALLTPALDKAIGEAERARCLANEKSIGMGIAFYLQDHQGAFPYGVPPNLPLEEEGVYPVVPYPPGTKPPHQVIVPYTSSWKTFTCPTDPSPTDFGWWVYNDYPDFFDPSPEGETHDDRDILGTPAAAIRGPGYNRGASYMFSEEATRWIVPYRHKKRKGSDGNLAYMADGYFVVNSGSWQKVDELDPAIPKPPPYFTLRVDWSHFQRINFLMADFSVQSVWQYNEQDGPIAYRIRSDPFKATLPDL